MTNHPNGIEPGGIPLIYAHQGGWDEILMVAVPILVIVGLLRVARRRAQGAGGGAAANDASEASGTDGMDGTDPIDAHTDQP